MRELALNVLDIVENSVKAGAANVLIRVVAILYVSGSFPCLHLCLC